MGGTGRGRGLGSRDSLRSSSFAVLTPAVLASSGFAETAGASEVVSLLFFSISLLTKQYPDRRHC
jgi:hypothetical protein